MALAAFAFANVTLYVSHAYLFLWAIGLTAIKPLYWYFATLISGTGLIVTHRECWTPTRPVVWLLVWSSTFVAVIVVSYFFSSQSETALQITISYGEALLIMAVMALVLQSGRAYYWAVIALLCTLMFSIAVNVVDLFSLVGIQFSTVSGRAAGFYENPNNAGKVLAIGMVLALPIVKRPLRFGFCLLVGAGVALTFSRAAIMMWAVAVFAMAWSQAFVLPRFQSVSIISAVLLVFGLALVAGKWVGILEQGGLGAHLNQNTQARISGSFTNQDDRSTRERLLVAKEGLRLFLDAPLFGHGVGATREWQTRVSTHNMYLLLGAEQGVVGLLLIFGLLWVLWRCRTPEIRTVAVLYAISGVFSHTNFEQPAMQVLVAMAVAGTGRLAKVGSDGRRSQLAAPAGLAER